MASRRGGIERVLSKLKNSIDNENYYEAHQMYRTLYFRSVSVCYVQVEMKIKIVLLTRYIGQKKYVELQSMLYDGAVLLFSHDQVASGTDLAKLYIDTLNEAESLPEEIHFIRISK